MNFGKDKGRRARLWERGCLLSAGLVFLCLLAGCAGREPGQAGDEDLQTGSSRTAAPAEGENPQAGSGTAAPQAGENPPAGTSAEGEPAGGAEQKPAGETEQAPPVLTDVLYDQKLLETTTSTKLQFLFSDGDTVERALETDFGVLAYLYVDYGDLTGDGTEEVVVHRYLDYEAERYGVLDIFQVDGKEIRQLYPAEGIEGVDGLESRIREEEVFLVDRYSRKGYGLHVKVYGEESRTDKAETEKNQTDKAEKNQADEAGQPDKAEENQPDKAGKQIALVVEEMDLFYEGGKWVRLPERELRASVSFESDRPEARIYEAFVRGECEAQLSRQYYSDNTWYLNPLPAGQESFSLKEILDTVVSGIRNERTLDNMEKVECALIDCGGDGELELAVRAYGLSIYSMRDDSETVMIFRCRDGKVEWIYSVDCWARSDTRIYTDGYVSGDGSGGAFTHYVWNGMIGADGVYREYNIYIEMGQSLYGMISYDHGDYGNEEEFPVEFYECTMGGETIYGYYILEDASEAAREKVMAYIAENEEAMGVKFLPSEEMDRQLDKWEESLGITEEMGERWETKAKRIPWQAVEGCEDYLYGQP